MGFYDAIRVGASGAAVDYTVDRSLRFDNVQIPLKRTLAIRCYKQILMEV